jgi:hypothetical protein
MTRRNLNDGFYIINATGLAVEWYARMADAERAAARRSDGPCRIEPATKEQQ